MAEQTEGRQRTAAKQQRPSEQRKACTYRMAREEDEQKRAKPQEPGKQCALIWLRSATFQANECERVPKDCEERQIRERISENGTQAVGVTSQNSTGLGTVTLNAVRACVRACICVCAALAIT